METPNLATAQHLFTQRAMASFKDAIATFEERGNQYSDTWRTCPWRFMLAAAGRLGLEINADEARTLALAAFCDMKVERLAGGWNDDHPRDLLNYLAALAADIKHSAPQ